jgi:hypothetical protein
MDVWIMLGLGIKLMQGVAECIQGFVYGAFRSHPKTKKFQDSPSHQILRHMHGALNIGKKNN